MAAPGWVICLVLLVILVQDRTSADSGSLNSCGGSKLQVSWTPKDLIANQKYTFKVDGDAAVAYDHGPVHSEVSIAATGKNIWNNTQDFTCDEMMKSSPIKIDCPIKKGTKMQKSFDYTLPDMFSVLPKGDYQVFLDIYNSNKEHFLCLKGTLTVANP